MPLSRLVKMRSTCNVDVVQPEKTVDEDRPPRLSIADLQNRRVVTTQRQLLHRLLSDTYANSRNSSAFFDSNEPLLYRAASSSMLNHQIGATTPASVTPKASIDALRPLGAAPTGKLDIEQAINLLQELKKTATPEELVSLHRALLPVKEVAPIYSPQVSSADDCTFVGSVPPGRRRSVMPPGLATRSGLSEDVLRKPQYSATMRVPSRERREMWSHSAQKNSAGKHTGAHGEQSTRPETPSEQPNTGSYHPGTLRIMNGAASPEPSIIARIAATAESYEHDGLDDSDTVVDANSVHTQQANRSRPSGPRHPLWQRRENLEVEVEACERQCSPSASKAGSVARRFSFDNATSQPPSRSPPRFQQRWTHRAAHLSQQYLMDCEISESPFDFEERATHLELVKRLSSVRDVENEDAGQQSDAYAEAMFKLTGSTPSTTNADDSGSEILAMQGSDEVQHHVDFEPPARAWREVDSGYGPGLPHSHSVQQQQTLEDANHLHGASALPVSEPPTPVPEPNTQASRSEAPILLDGISLYNFEEILGDARAGEAMDSPLANIAAKRPSPLSFFKSRHKVPKKSSSLTLTDGTPNVSSPVHGSNPDSVKQPKRLQKRVPESVRRQRQLEAEKKLVTDEGRETVIPDECPNPVAGRTDNHPEAQLTTDEDTQTVTADATDDSSHRFRLRGKSFGRKRSKTNLSEHSTETVFHTPAFRTRARRSLSTSGYSPALSGRSHGSNCMSSPGQKQQSSDEVPSEGHSEPHALSSNLRFASQDDNRSTSMPKSAQECQQPDVDSTHRSSAPSSSPHDLPEDVPMPKGPLRATLEGNERVIPIGAHGSVEDLFPDWQSRPAATPPPASTPPSTHMQARQPYKSRSALSVSSIPPLPEFPADIESKVSRAEQMVAKKMMNSQRNSARNSPQPSMQSSVESPSSLAKKSAGTVTALQNDANEETNTKSDGEPTVNRWSIDGSIPLPPAAGGSQTASSTRDPQHPGWPGWEKQAEMWRQRKIGLGHALSHSVDMAGKIPVECGFSPPSPSIVVSRPITPLGANHTDNAQQTTGEDSKAEKLAEAYFQLFADDKENWPTQKSMQRADSVDSTATCGTTSSEGRQANTDISRTGSAYSDASSTATAASSNTSTGMSPCPVVEKKPAPARPQSFTPYRPADAVRAERSRALSMARSSCVSTPQNSLASVLDRYSGGLSYGWDRSTGFGGSAGTRSSGTEAANRKSVKISEDYGLDLSDVPVFLRRV